MHLGSSRVLTPLKTFVKSMLTHVHKEIHIVFSTWEQGFETSPVECPPVECGQSDGATGALYRKDKVSEFTGRWSQLDRSVRSVEAVKTLASVFDRTLGHFMTGHGVGASGPADVAAQRRGEGPNTVVASNHDRPNTSGRS